MKINSAILIITLLVFGCKTNQSKLNPEQYSVIAKGNLHGAGEEGFTKENMVITSQSEWESLRSQMDAVNNVSDNFSDSEIDFSRYRVIAIFDEVKSTGGHSLGVSIQANSDTLIVDVIRKAPEGMATTVVTQPFYLIKIPKSDLQIEFK